MKKYRNKKKLNDLACTQSGDRKCHFQGHVTLTYKVTRQSYDIGLYFVDFLEFKKLRNKKNHCCSMYTSRDRKCHFQGHVTLTYKGTRQGHDIRLYAIDFSELKNLRNQKKIIAVACIQAEIESVTFKVTWPWRKRSRVKVTTFAYILLTFLRWITLETKKNWMFQHVYLSNYYSISLFSEFEKLWRHSRSRRDVSWVTMSKIITQYSSYATPRGIPEISLGYLFPSSSYRWL